MKKLTILLAVFALVFFSRCERITEVHNNVTVQTNSDSLVSYLEKVLSESYDNVTHYNVDVGGSCNFIIFYSDRDSTGSYTDGKDLEIDNISWCNDLQWETESFINDEGCTVFEVIINGEVVFSKEVCPDTIYIPGEDINHAFLFFGFNSGSTPDFEGMGFENANASESDGCNRFFFSWWEGDQDQAWTKYPEYISDNSNTDTISLLWGSSCKYYVELIEESYLGEERILWDDILEGIEGFDAKKDETYHRYDLYPPKGNYTGKRLFIKVTKVAGEIYGFTRNQQFNISKIYVRYSWK